MTTTLTLPKPYISWSQLNLWETSRSQYIKRYFENESMFETKELKFGKNFSEIVEEQNFFGASEKEKAIFSRLTVHNKTEVELNANIDGINLIGFLDTAEVKADKVLKFREYKTGKVEWTNKRATQHGQLYFYSLMVRENTGKLPESVYLDWIPTQENENRIEFTGSIKSFRVKVTEKNVQLMKERIKKVASEISEAFERWKQQKKENINEKLLKDYWKLQMKSDELKAKTEELKVQIQINFEDSLVDNYQTDFGSFYFTKRKKYEYSEKVKILDAKLKELKRAEEQTAPFSESKSFTFRKK